jgi:hypothetical protein
MSANLVPTSADRGCRVVSAAHPYGRHLAFLDRGVLIVATIKLHSPVKARPTFGRNIPPPSSGSMKQETNKRQTVSNILVNFLTSL